MRPPCVWIRTAAASAVFVAALAVSPSSEAGKILPDFEVAGPYEAELPVGFISLATNFTFPLGGGAEVNLGYDEKGRLVGAGFVSGGGLGQLLLLRGTYSVENGVQTVHLEEPSKKPGFLFDGTVAPGSGDLVGEFVRKDGYAGLAGDDSGPLRIDRTDPFDVPTSFTLEFDADMDRKGVIRGAPVTDAGPGKIAEKLAVLEVFGTQVFEGGKVRGRIKTKRDGSTTGKLRIRGKGWKVTMKGPVEIDGFMATVSVKAGGFKLDGIPLVLPVGLGPLPPPPPPPKPPKNLQSDAVARIADGQVTITHTGVKSKFFGKKAAVTLRFPLADGETASDATPATFLANEPRLMSATLGNTVFSTQHAGALVTFDVRQLTVVRGAVIILEATGMVFAPDGKSKNVSILFHAQVQ